MAKFDEALGLLKNHQADEAVTILKEGSANGEYKCSYQLANLYIPGIIIPKDLEQSKKYFDITRAQVEAIPANSDTNFLLGTMYLFGLGSIVVDKEKAVAFLEKAADEKNLDAILLLINCYRNGNGVAANPQKAFELTKQALATNHPAAIRLYGDCLYFGQGVAQNFEEAYKHYKDAADKGDIKALFTTGTCYYEGKGVAKDDDMAFAYFLKAAQAGYPDAMRNVAFFYNQGIAMEQDFGKEAEWLEKLANQGNPDGMYSLACCFLDKKHTIFRYREGIELLKKAGAVGHPQALMMLGHIYEMGQYGVLPQGHVAFNSYNTAFEKGFKPAAVDLKRCYTNGIGVQPNMVKASEMEKIVEELSANNKNIQA